MFNFDEFIERYNSDKWKKYLNKDIIPMWLADTDFRVPDCIINALLKRVQYGVFGYESSSDIVKNIFIKRVKKKYNWNINPDWIVFLPGSVSALYVAVRSICSLVSSKIGVVVPSVIYPPFFSSIKKFGCSEILAPMKYVQNRWCVDFFSCAQKVTKNEKLLMLCNPHNPVGTLYNKQELLEHLEFACKNNLFVCSDEVHCELILNSGINHVPFASLNEDAEKRSITFMSPSKSFNIAGLGISFVIIPNIELRQVFLKEKEGIVPSVSPLSLSAAQAAWSEGNSWLLEQINYLRNNRDFLVKIIKNCPGISVNSPEATFLAWINVEKLNLINPQVYFEKYGIGLSSGIAFGDKRFVRLNFGCCKNLLKIALERIVNACQQKIKIKN